MSKALAVNATVSGRQRFFDFLYKWGMLLTVVLLVAVFGFASDNFLDPFNIINILRSIAIVTVIAIGVSISLTIGGFDLSVGSTASLANALVISLFVWHGLGTTEAILITLALCTLVGLFNAFLIVVLRIPDMLATLASLFVIQGVAMTYSYGGSITENMVLPSGEMAEGTLPAAFGALGQVPTIVIIMLVVTLVARWRCPSPPTAGGCTPSAATRRRRGSPACGSRVIKWRRTWLPRCWPGSAAFCWPRVSDRRRLTPAAAI